MIITYLSSVDVHTMINSYGNFILASIALSWFIMDSLIITYIFYTNLERIKCYVLKEMSLMFVIYD